jgi:hypothetical protein
MKGGGVLIRIEGLASGNPCSVAGEYVRDFSVHGPGQRGVVTTTNDPARAKLFADAGAAFKYWKQTHGTRPYDGKPNRPLTAYTVLFLPADDARRS